MANIFDLFKKIESPSSPVTGPVSFLIVGLGNPGTEYENTRHNAGFIAMDHLAAHLHVDLKTARFQSLCTEAVIDGTKVLLLKPQTYMNLSGDAVCAAAAFYHLTPDRILVLSDDVNLDIGRVRIRKSGSDGGQKGLRSIIQRLGSDAFPRIRIGVGAKPAQWEMVDWVLSKFSADERKLLDGAAAKCPEAVRMILDGQIEKAMGAFNGK
jgi:PTH1 family peptidyl-tRNA hydrolase